MEENVRQLVEFINNHPEIIEQYTEMKGLMEPFKSKATAISTIKDKNESIISGPIEVELTPSSEEEVFRSNTSGWLDRLLKKTNRIERTQQPTSNVNQYSKEVVTLEGKKKPVIGEKELPEIPEQK